MSAGGGDYVLTIKLKDPQGVFQMIKNAEERGLGGAVGKAAGKGGGLMTKLADLNIMQVAKLAGIAGSMAQLVHLGIKSSGILQGTMKMWETTIMLMLKPIADFIGLMLRPVTVLLLTQVIIPFYKHVMPWFRDAGKGAGGVLAQGFFPEATGHKPLIADLSSDNLGKQWETFTTNLGTGWEQFTSNLNTQLAPVPGKFFDVFSKLGSDIWSFLQFVPTFIFQRFSDLSIYLGRDFLGIPGMIVGVFSSLATSLSTALANIPKLIWDAITSWIPSLDLPGPKANRPGMPRSSRTTVAAIAETV